MKIYTIRNQDGITKQVTEDQLADYGLEIPKAKKGGMIKRADGSYSRPGLWDNIRANKGSGKKPTKAMLAQERKIRAAEKAYGGYMAYGGMYDMGGLYPMGGYVPMDTMATGGCMECGGKMQNGGTPFQNYLQKYPSRPATDTLVGTPFYGDTPASEQLRVNDLLKARQQTPNLGNRWNTEEKMNPSIYDWDPASYPNITPANKPFKPVMQKGGKTFADIERERANMYKQMTTPIGASKYTDYPPTYTVSPTPKQKGKAKPVYPVIQPKKYIPLPASAIQDVNIEYPYGQEMPPQPFNYPVGKYLPGSYVQSPEYAEGGKLPAELLRARLEAHMSPSEAQDYLNKYQEGGSKANKQKITQEDIVQRDIENQKYFADYAKKMQDRAMMMDQMSRPYQTNYSDSLSLNLPNVYERIPLDFYRIDSPYAMGGQLDEAGDGKWIQKAINPAHKGYCTPMTKATCTPRRKALAKTLRKMAKSRKADGGYTQGGEYEMTDAQIAKLRAMGYKIKEV